MILKVGDRIRYDLSVGSWDRSEWGRTVLAAWRRRRKRAREAGHVLPEKPKRASATGVVTGIEKKGAGPVEEVDVHATWAALVLVDFGWGTRGLAVGRSMAQPMVPELLEG